METQKIPKNPKNTRKTTKIPKILKIIQNQTRKPKRYLKFYPNARVIFSENLKFYSNLKLYPKTRNFKKYYMKYQKYTQSS